MVSQKDKVDVQVKFPKDSFVEVDTGVVRKFATGATRDTATNKLDYEGFESPLVMDSYARYLHRHRRQRDGSLRDSDNWQNGIPKSVYMKSMIRHMIAVWKIHRGYKALDENGFELDMEDSLNGVIFNAKGYIFELLGGKSGASVGDAGKAAGAGMTGQMVYNPLSSEARPHWEDRPDANTKYADRVRDASKNVVGVNAIT